MGLTGKNNEEKAWNFLKSKITNDFGVAGLMGNLYAERRDRPAEPPELLREKARFHGRHIHRSRRLRELCQFCA